MPSESAQKPTKSCFPRPAKLRSALMGGLVGMVLVPLAGGALQQPNPPRNVPEFLNRLPDFGDQERMKQAREGEKSNAAANASLQKRVSDDSAKLLKLASDLKVEVDKSGKDTLSLDVLRKAGKIEKLAKTIKSEVAQESRFN
jgi:hypothetical protein